MKYIKTKNGIYERMFPNTEQEMSFDHKNIEPAYYTVNHEWIAKKDVIKQADTIEELCDEFIFVCAWNKKHYRCNYHGVYVYVIELEDDYYYPCDDFHEVYGAIWTDKGLIYVAKMNDKGELELI